MMRLIRWSLALSVPAVAMLFFAAGCQPPRDGGKDTTAKTADKVAAKDKGGKHGHGDGPHGGPLVEWGDEEYHAEFTVDHAAKKAVVYILGSQPTKAPKIEPEKITNVKLSITNVKPLVVIDLTHDPKLTDEKGIAFVGTHDALAKPAEIIGAIDGKVAGKTYSGDLTYKPSDKTKGAYLRDLYLKPGGIYTVADIKANGNTVASEKFMGKSWEHGDKKIGDKICPVTDNKAEAECFWIVNGQRYEFCCHPCVDKFMKWAHHEPDKIKDSKEYIFRGM